MFIGIFKILAKSMLCILSISFMLYQADAAENVTGVLKGKIEYEGGIPYIGSVIIIPNGNGIWINKSTDHGGEFESIVPSGKVEVNVNGGNEDTCTSAIIGAGTVTNVLLKLKRNGGIILSLSAQHDGSALDAKSTVSCSWITDKYPEYGYGYILNDGRIWFPMVPPSIKSFHVKITRGFNGLFVSTHSWKFTEPDVKRSLIYDIPPLVSALIEVHDANGLLLRNTSLAKVNIDIPAQGDEIESKSLMIPQPSTDATGKLIINSFVLGYKYYITIYDNNSTGGKCPFTIKSQETTLETVYVMSLVPRKIKQCIYTTSGKPASNTLVHISYNWLGKIVIQDATTDRHGFVIWNTIPPVTSFVWGLNIPVSEIHADQTEIMKPMPVLDDMSSYSYTIKFKVHLHNGVNDDKFDGYAIKGFVPIIDDSLQNANDIPLIHYQTADLAKEYKTLEVSISGSAMVGIPVGILLWSNTSGRYAMLQNIYLPPGGGSLEISMPEPIIAKLRLHSTDGKIIANINQFSFEPDDTNPLIRLFQYNKYVSHKSFPTPKQLGNGDFEVSIPCTGGYRICIDGYISTQPAPDALHFAVTKNNCEVDLTMPDPLVKVPAGVNLYCLPLTSPATPTIYPTKNGNGGEIPIFVDWHTVLAYWYYPTPDTLKVWKVTDIPRLIYDHSRKSVILTVMQTDADEKILLLPLLPGPDQTNNNREQNNPNTPLQLEIGKPTTLLLWPGEYIICRQQDNIPLVSFKVAEDQLPNTTINIHLPLLNRASVLPDLTLRSIILRLPDNINYGTLINNMMVIDSSGLFRQLVNSVDIDDIGKVIRLDILSTVQSLTLQRLGYGIVKDIDIKNKDVKTIYVTNWKDGVPCSGVITGSDGKAFTNRIIAYTLDGINTDVVLDKNGHFSISGVLPGILIIQSVEDSPIVWQVEIPENGNTDIVLSSHVAMTILNYHVPTHHEGEVRKILPPVWWLPDYGLATYIKAKVPYLPLKVTNMPAGNGYLWKLDDESHGRNTIQRAVMPSLKDDETMPGFIFVDDAKSQVGSTLGIILPYNQNEPCPGAININIQNQKDVKEYVKTPQWKLNTLLKCITTTVYGIPPGVYDVSIITENEILHKQVTITSLGGYIKIDKQGRYND